MMNQDNPYAMNQTCKVCGEPAAGFHFGAFTCEGCKSFFGRSYNNLSSISDCKNNGECVINKKNRTACKACRLRKCLMVGMSKSGSRYGRRSNWFKIHCLLQEQQQQAAAAMAAHHNSQQHHHQQAVAAAAAAHGQLPPGHVPPPAAAAAALGMLGHAGAYPGLYPPRTKEELMMLGLEEYAKHPAASPSVSSPDSHNSDSSVEASVRSNPLLHLSAKHGGAPPDATAATTTASSMAAAAPQLRKDLPPFLPLPFSALAGMPVMPPPAFLPPSHLLFSGYHSALYQHHQGLLKPSAEQQQQHAAAAAAAVQHLFNSAHPAVHRFAPTTALGAGSPLPAAARCSAADKAHEAADSPDTGPQADTLNNNHIPNGELTKRTYLDAVLQSQRSHSPAVATTKLLGTHAKHDHSISALVTPNSESGRERLTSRQSLEEDEDIAVGVDSPPTPPHHVDEDSDCGEELVVSMTPPRSPVAVPAAPPGALHGQDNPIDLSLKTVSSATSSLSSNGGSVQAVDSENEIEADVAEAVTNNKESSSEVLSAGHRYGADLAASNTTRHTGEYNCSNIANHLPVSGSEEGDIKCKRKREQDEAIHDEFEHVKRLKQQFESALGDDMPHMDMTKKFTKPAPLDLTTKV